MSKSRSIIAILCVSFLFYTPLLYSLEVATHEAINVRIVGGSFDGFSTDSYLKNNLGFNNGINERVDNRRVWEWLRDGGRYEDIPAWYLIYRRSVNHFHNPITDRGFSGWFFGKFLSGESSRDWFQKSLGTQSPGGYYSWHDARDYFYKGLTLPNKPEREKYFGETFRGLGQLMHLVQDLSVPAHARDDPHIVGYEMWVRDNIDPSAVGLLSFDTSILKIPTSGLAIANIFDSNQYNGTNPDLTAGKNVGLSEYTNANFFSENTINSFNFFYPRIEDNTPVVTKPYKGPGGFYDRQYFLKDRKGETNAGKGYLLSAVDYHDYWRKNNPGATIDLPIIPVLDENVYRDYASLLIPRAVGYSAGLLNYFFRGKLDVRQSDTKPDGKIEITITNLSDDTLVAGEFELYYDNNNGERQKINDFGPNSVANLLKYDPQKPETMLKATFSAPINFDPEKKSKYMLVYRGKLGKEDGSVEEGAVIGKYAFIGKALPVLATYDFGLNKIFFKGNGLKGYIDLNGIVDNCHDGPDYLRGQPYEGVTDRRVLWVTQAASITYLKAFSLLEENGIYGAFVTGLSTLYGEYGLESESSYKVYKFKLTSKSAGNETYTWVYSDTNYTDRENPYCQPDHVYTNFTVTDTYDRYDFDWTVEDLANIPDMAHPGVVGVRGFKVYSKVGMDLSNLGQLKYAIGGTFRDSETGDMPSPSLFWYDSGETAPAWHSILTGCSLDQYSDIYNCAFAISGGLDANEITDVVVVWTQGHRTTWPISGVDYWDWYVTDKNGDQTYLYRENSTRPPYNIGATFSTWVDMDRKGGGIKNDRTDRIQIIAGAVDWFNAGKGFYRINGRWYSEDSVPSQYFPEHYPFGAIRGKELAYSTMGFGELKCPVVDEKSIAWSREWCLGMHHAKGFRYRIGYQNYDHSILAPMTYYYGKVYEQSSILGYSRPSRALVSVVWKSFIDGLWVPASYDLIDYWNFISDFAVIPSGE